MNSLELPERNRRESFGSGNTCDSGYRSSGSIGEPWGQAIEIGGDERPKTPFSVVRSCMIKDTERLLKLRDTGSKGKSKRKEEANEEGEDMIENNAEPGATGDQGSSLSPVTLEVNYGQQMEATEPPPRSLHPASSDEELTGDDSDITDSNYASSSNRTWSLASISSALEPPRVATCTILTQYQSRLVDNLMSEFHTLISSGGIIARSRAPSEESSSNSHGDGPSSHNRPQEASSTGSGSNKRSRDQDTGNGRSGEDQDQGGDSPKMQRISSPSVSTTPRRLACPYFRQNSTKHVKHRSCAGPGWMTVHRVKEHVYRRHSVSIRCARCGEAFESEADLEQHYRQPERCEVRSEDVLQPEGMTKEQEKSLRKRKRLVSEEEKWRDMYRILFPSVVDDEGDDDNIPSPYYDDAPAQFADEFQRYEQYLHTELPQLVRRRLEEAVSGFTTPLENQLRAQLVDIVRNSQSELFRSYRSPVIGNIPGQGLDAELPQSSLMSQQSPVPASGSHHHLGGGENPGAQYSDQATAALQDSGHVSSNHFVDPLSLVDFSAYGEPPALDDQELLARLSSTDMSSWAAPQHANNTTENFNTTSSYSVFSDSGYGSNMNGEFGEFSGCYDDGGPGGKEKGI